VVRGALGLSAVTMADTGADVAVHPCSPATSFASRRWSACTCRRSLPRSRVRRPKSHSRLSSWFST